jgi:hypothetical protein
VTRRPARQRRIVGAVRRNLVAWLALFFALTGTGLAASRYIITNTSQIKPSVLRELRGSGLGAQAATGTPKGPKAIIHRIRGAGPYTTISEPGRPSVPLTNASWTQAPEQAEEIFGDATITSPSATGCRAEGGGNVAILEMLVDGSNDGSIIAEAEPTESTGTYYFEWSRANARSTEGSTLWLAESGAATPHTVTARASDDCLNGGHFKIDSITIDVIGLR